MAKKIEKKIGIFILCHHKPWLLKSSLMSLALQNNKYNYELNFILIKGSGEPELNNELYEDYFKNLNRTGERNTQLSEFDENVSKLIKNLNQKNIIINFKNDHGLDSGAWIKLIKNKHYWEKYDYCLCLMEGFLLTSTNIIPSIMNFINKFEPDFLSSAHEKRFLNLDQLRNTTEKSYKSTAVENIWKNLEKIPEIGEILNKENYRKFERSQKIFDSNLTEYHLPKYRIDIFNLIKLFLKSITKFKLNIFKKKIIVSFNKKYFLNLNQISNETTTLNGCTYHIEENPLFFGCSCQHLFSKKTMINMNEFFHKNKIYEISNLPYFGEVFEIVWSFMPKIFKTKKWFFDGVHRVRKNIINYKREDDPEGMVKYLNLYYPKEKFYTDKKNIFCKNLNLNNL